MQTELTSVRNPRVKDVVRLRNRRHRDRERRFVVEGVRELTCAVDAGFALEAVYHCEDLHGARGGQVLIDRIAAAGVECQPTSRAVFERMSYRRTPDGLLGVAPTPDLGFDRLDAAADSLWLVAAGIEKPGNLGAMLRSADAAGASGVLVADPATDVFNPNVVRASLGTLFSVPIAVAAATEVCAWLAEQGVRVVVARPDADLDYVDVDLRSDVALVVGSEHEGLGAAWLSPHCEAVRIPMAGRADSINAAMAATVLLFEARRQRLASFASGGA